MGNKGVVQLPGIDDDCAETMKENEFNGVRVLLLHSRKMYLLTQAYKLLGQFLVLNGSEVRFIA